MRKRPLRKQIATVTALCVLTAATITGTPAVAATGVPSPLNGSADPSLVYYDGSYYLATTLGNRIGIWKSSSLAGLPAAPETVVWRDSDPSRNQQMWAPAMHRVFGPSGIRWYIYYTASNGVDANHRMYVLESAADNPMGPYHFKARLADFGEYAIDGELFGHNGRLYFAWSGPGRGMGGPAQIYLSAMSNPWTTSGGRVALPASGGCNEVREGASFLHRNGRTFLVYSTCDTGKPDYQLWMKSLPDGADPLNAANWTQHGGPVFWRNDAAGVFGPGHNSFFRSPDGTEDWIAYHAKTTSAYTYEGRTTRAQRISWNGDGTPNLGRPLPLGAAHALPSGDVCSPSNHLAFVKTRNTGTGTIEVHQTPNPFTSYDMNSPSGLSEADEEGHGTFSMAGDKLVYVKTSNTGSGKIELHWRTAGSGFTSGYSTSTFFGLGDTGNGTFNLVGSDLYFIKTRNTGTGTVEVHKVSSDNNYQNPPVVSTGTPISTDDAVNGTFQMYGNDLVFIKTRNVGAGKVEVHILDGSSGYSHFEQQAVTVFDQAEDGNGVFRYGNVVGCGDLIFIKTRNTGTGTVELFAANSSNGYSQVGLATGTVFSLSDADNGWWGMNN